MIEISKEHTITGELESIEIAVKPIIIQLNSNGLPLDIGITEKIRNQYLEFQYEWADKIYSLVGYKFNLGKKIEIERAFEKEEFRIGKRTNAIVLDSLIRKGSKLAPLIKQYRQLQRIASNGQSLLNYYDHFLGKLNPVEKIEGQSLNSELYPPLC